MRKPTFCHSQRTSLPYNFHLYKTPRIGKSIGAGSRLVVTRGWEGGRERGGDSHRVKVWLQGDVDALKVMVVTVAQYSEYTENTLNR